VRAEACTTMKTAMVNLPGLSEIAPATFSDDVQSPSGSTPLAKRQRRLTLTAMTGLISDLAQNSTAEPEAEPPSEGAGEDTSVFLKSKVVRFAEKDLPPDLELTAREASPQRRLKRARASISVTAGADVMAARAVKTLSAGTTSAGPAPCTLTHRHPTFLSESSTSDEEEEDSLALRVRRARAFNTGVRAVESAADGGLQEVGKLSPRSRQAFSSGARAAQVAAKVAAEMLAKKAVAGQSTPSLRKLPPTPLRPPSQ